MTTATIEHRHTGDSFPEFLRIPDVERLYGIRRSTLYGLIKSGQVKSVSLRKEGARTGIRLVATKSLRELLNSQMT